MTVEMRPIASIKVTDRVRDTFGDLRELIGSLRDRGQINPITVKADGTLIAGERRWRAARELGWTEIACHVWQDETAEQLLAIEIEENTCRAQLTLTEAERAWQKYRQLFGVREGQDRDRDENGEFAAPQTPRENFTRGDELTESRLNDKLAEVTGYSRPTLARVQEIREIVADEAEPEPVRQVAKEELRKLSATTRGATTALDKVRQAKRQATRDAMSPGQWLKSDEPKAQPKAASWHERLWNVVGTGQRVRMTAEELELDPDTGSLSDDDIRQMAKLLQEQITDRQYLRKVLLGIKEERKAKQNGREE
jgi:ParB/Sulfiredoxin domain